MMKTSRLLGSTDAQHCLAHVIHLILTTDGFSKCTRVKDLLEKCRNVVTSLNFKSAALLNEAVKSNDAEIFKQLRSMAELKEVQDLEDQFPVQSNPATAVFTDEQEHQEHSKLETFDRQHRSLKMQVCTRWNSALFMLDSIKQMLDPIQNLLKQIGKRELCFDSDEQDLL
jgi:hypothetical protein